MRVTITVPAADAYVDGEPMPDTPQALAVQDAIYHTVHGYPGGVAALAARMGLPPGTLTHKANPNNTTHHMRPDELVAMQHFSGNFAVLQAMAAALGHAASPAMPTQAGGDPAQSLVQLQVAFADLIRAAADPLQRLVADPQECVTSNELHRAQQMAEDCSAAIAHLLGALRSRKRAAPVVDY